MEDTAINKVIANGRLITKGERPNGDVYVTLLSRNGRDLFMRFICTKDMVADIPLRAHVTITGFIRSYEYKDKKDGKTKFYQTFVADKVEQDMTLIEKEFGPQYKGKFYAEPSCAIYLKGTVLNIRDEGTWIRYLISTEDHNRPGKNSIIRLSMRKLDRQPDIQKNDTVLAVCSASTTKKEINGKTEYFEDIIISDICK